MRVNIMVKGRPRHYTYYTHCAKRQNIYVKEKVFSIIINNRLGSQFDIIIGFYTTSSQSPSATEVRLSTLVCIKYRQHIHICIIYMYIVKVQQVCLAIPHRIPHGTKRTTHDVRRELISPCTAIKFSTVKTDEIFIICFDRVIASVYRLLLTHFTFHIFITYFNTATAQLRATGFFLIFIL